MKKLETYNQSSTVTKLALATWLLFATLQWQAQETYSQLKKDRPQELQSMYDEMKHHDWHWLNSYNFSDAVIRLDNHEVADEVLFAWNISFIKATLNGWYLVEKDEDTAVLEYWLSKFSIVRVIEQMSLEEWSTIKGELNKNILTLTNLWVKIATVKLPYNMLDEVK